GRPEEKRGGANAAPHACRSTQGRANGNGTNRVSTGLPVTLTLKLYFRSRNMLAAVPSIVSIHPTRVTGPMSSPGAPFWIFTAGPALTSPLREFRKNWFRFRLMSASCTWSQQTNSQEVDTKNSQSGLVDETVARLSFQNDSGTKVGLFGRFDSTSRVRKVMNVWLSTAGAGPGAVVLSNLTSPTNSPVILM